LANTADCQSNSPIVRELQAEITVTDSATPPATASVMLEHNIEERIDAEAPVITVQPQDAEYETGGSGPAPALRLRRA